MTATNKIGSTQQRRNEMKEYKPSGAIAYGLKGRRIDHGKWTDWTGGSQLDRSLSGRKSKELNERADYSDVRVYARVEFSIPLDELPDRPVWVPGQENVVAELTDDDLAAIEAARRAVHRLEEAVTDIREAHAELPL